MVYIVIWFNLMDLVNLVNLEVLVNLVDLEVLVDLLDLVILVISVTGDKRNSCDTADSN